jgi:predicted metalloprotease with PDZ domain
VHSWNGKFRRPAGLATGDFSTPMKDDLLWVYEGLTQYLGKVLAARSALWTPDEYRENLALLASRLDHRPGREWRPLQDTADEASLLYYGRSDWDALRRDTDFYDEGALIWLEVDVTIRQLTSGKQSLDTFCKIFHGGDNSGPVVRPYTLDDIVRTLDEVAPHDWQTFFTTRLTSLDAHAPLRGIEEAGWKVAYGDTPTSMQEIVESTRNVVDLSVSVGLILQQDGTLLDVVPGTPAARSGLAPGMKIVAVNGRQYSKETLRAALRLGKTSTTPLELLAANGQLYRTYAIDYHDGERYPYLERDPSKRDLLASIIASTAKP